MAKHLLNGFLMFWALVLMAYALSGCAGHSEGWALVDVIELPAGAPCYSVGVTAAGGRDLPEGAPDVVRVVRPAWGDAAPGGLSVRAYPSELIEVYARGDVGLDAITVAPLPEACR